MNSLLEKLIMYPLGAVIAFFLACYLIRLGICLLSQIWWIILLMAVGTIAAMVGYRAWRNHHWQ